MRDESRLLSMAMTFGAISGDVYFDRVTYESLQRNLEKHVKEAQAWLEDVRARK